MVIELIQNTEQKINLKDIIEELHQQGNKKKMVKQEGIGGFNKKNNIVKVKIIV